MEPSAPPILYFMAIDGEKCGPYQLAELIDAGLERDTLVWWAGMEAWVPAGRLPNLAKLLNEARREQKLQRKAVRRAARMPTPGLIRGLHRAVQCVNLAAGFFYLLGTCAFIAGVVFLIVAISQQPNAQVPPNPKLMFGAQVTLVPGLATTGLAALLLVTDMVLVLVFVWHCRRIARAAAPERSTTLSEVGGFLDQALPVHLAGRLPPVYILLIVFSAGYMFFAFSIYRVGFGLNQVIDRYKLTVPWAPITLGFWTALCGLLLIAGPLSLPLFVLLPIWAYRTARTATMICDDECRKQIEIPLPDEKPKALPFISAIEPMRG